MKRYQINEIFYSLQGEGMRGGEASYFVRFSQCNLTCKKETHGFDCDTEFASGRRMTAEEIIGELRTLSPSCQWIVLTGGEPALQIDAGLIDALHAAGYKLAIETNGSVEVPPGLDWVTVSPKVEEHEVKQRTATEVKYVRGYGQELPKTVVEAQYQLLSPVFNGQFIDRRSLEWCIALIRDNPSWRLSVQQHKLWRVR
jgi:organic radical activating enzyme